MEARDRQVDDYGIWADDASRSELHELASNLAAAGPDTPVAIRVGDEQPVVLPAPAREALERVAAYLAASDFVAIRPLEQLVTTQQAAELLGVSRPFLIEHLLGDGEDQIPYQLRAPGSSHRRIRLADVLGFREGFASDAAASAQRDLLRRRADFREERQQRQEPAY